jgi:hypothetical protein
MRTAQTVAFALFTFTGTFAQNTYQRSVHFASGSAVLDSTAHAVLDKVATRMRADKSLMIELAGHTDAQGDDRYNHALADARVKAVSKALLARGIPPTLVKTDEHGETAPVADNGTDDGRSANRRVDIRMLRNTAGTNAATTGTTTAEVVKVEPPVEVDNDTTIIGPLGTRLRMPKDVFCEDFGKVRFDIQELPTMADMLANDLPTQTPDGGCLVSDGVLRMRATVDGKDVQPCDGKQVEVTIPADEMDPEMDLYALQTTADGREEWVKVRAPLQRSKDGSEGYTFRTSNMGTFNLDKLAPPAPPIPLGRILARFVKRDNGLVVRSRRMDFGRAYLGSTEANMVVRGDVFQPDRTRFQPCSIRRDATFTSIFEQDGKTYLVNKPLMRLRFNWLTGRFVIRKRDYEEVTADQLKARLRSLAPDTRTGALD